MNTPPSDARAFFVRSVKRAFADALVAEIRRARLRRWEVAESGRISCAYLQLLLRADRHATIGTLISLAEGMGVSPPELLAKTMENLSRIRHIILLPESCTASCVHDLNSPTQFSTAEASQDLQRDLPAKSVRNIAADRKTAFKRSHS
jgi:hypothetical protein